MSESNIEELKDFKPFTQTPTWAADAVFQMSGVEFEHVYKILQPFMSLAFIFQGIMDKKLNDGTIQIKYEYTDGSGEVNPEEVEAMTEKFMNLLDKQKKDQAEVEKEIKPLNSKIITDI